MQVVQAQGPATLRGNLVQIAMDSAEILSPTPLAVGSKLTFTVEGHPMPHLPARVVSAEPDTGSGYRLRLRLSGSFPYQVFVTLSQLAGELDDSRSAPAETPPFLAALGLALPCSVADVQRAFDRQVRAAHPDRGGNVEQFVRLRSAYQESLRFLKELGGGSPLVDGKS